MKEKLKRQITISSAFDKRSEDSNKDYGIGSSRIFFAVIGKKGAITVNFGTNWFLPSTIKEYKEEGIYRNRLTMPPSKEQSKTKIDLIKVTEPIKAWSWDYHSKKRKFKGQTPLDNCEFTGGKCYCDGSCLRADDYLKLLLDKGSNGVFEQLEKDYKIEFEIKEISKKKKKEKKLWII